jgi:hypothetical protein
VTCHVRKRKPIANIDIEKKRFINLKEEQPFYIQEEIEMSVRLRKEKKEKNDN